MSANRDNSPMRNLGEMIGNIAAGIFADPAKPPRRLRDRPLPPPIAPAPAGSQVVHQRVQEVTIITPSGPMTIRRTVTDEIVAPRP